MSAPQPTSQLEQVFAYKLRPGDVVSVTRSDRMVARVEILDEEPFGAQALQVVARGPVQPAGPAALMPADGGRNRRREPQPAEAAISQAPAGR